jgi:predicted AlkP superfamily pyrophosphatase or phosphodiesterase
VVIGVDGLEWEVMLPLIRQRRLPTMTRLMEQGIFGKLGTLTPARSPAIWTSVATGKHPAKHGIPHFFAQPAVTGEPRLYTNRDRETKALWNIFTDFDQTVHSVGWWMTFPAESVNGTMVAQTNTRSQVFTARGQAVWKGTVVPGLEGQVYPPAFQPQVMEIAVAVGRDVPLISRAVFGKFKHPRSKLTKRLWDNTQWSFRADAIYHAVIQALLAGDQRFDLLLAYFGGTDVVGHRFWRYLYPDEFQHKPTPEEIEDLADIIPDYYAYIDSVIGDILDAVPDDATIVIISDHGMHTINQNQHFTATLPPVDVNSAHHRGGRPGIIIAAGTHLRAGTASREELEQRTWADIPTVGTVLDIAPTILALKGLPLGRDMDGFVLEDILEEGFLARHQPTWLKTRDTETWIAERPSQFVTSQMEQERIQQLKALGYLE